MDEDFEKLKQRLPLLDYLRQRNWSGRPAGPGSEFVGLCPLHPETRSSFYVNARKNLFYCHGCGQGGDLIRLVELSQRLSFSQSLTYLQQQNAPADVADALERATVFYQQQLPRHPEALRYLSGLVVSAAALGRPRPLYRLVGRGAAPQPPFSGLQSSLPDFALGPGEALGIAHPGAAGATDRGRLGADLWASDLLPGDLRGSRTPPRHLLPGGELGADGANDGAGEELPNKRPNRSIKDVLGYPLTPRFRELLAEG